MEVSMDVVRHPPIWSALTVVKFPSTRRSPEQTCTLSHLCEDAPSGIAGSWGYDAQLLVNCVALNEGLVLTDFELNIPAANLRVK